MTQKMARISLSLLIATQGAHDVFQICPLPTFTRSFEQCSRCVRGSRCFCQCYEFCRKRGKRSGCIKYCRRHCCRTDHKAKPGPEVKTKTLRKKKPVKDIKNTISAEGVDISDEIENVMVKKAKGNKNTKGSKRAKGVEEGKDNTGERHSGNTANKRNCCCSDEKEDIRRKEPRISEEIYNFRNLRNKAYCCCSDQRGETTEQEEEPNIIEERYKFRNMRGKDKKANKRNCCCSEQNEEARQKEPRIIEERYNFRSMRNKANCCCSDQREESPRREEEPQITEDRYQFRDARRRGKSGSKRNRKITG